MRMIWIVAACGMLAGCMTDSPAALQSPDVHALGFVGQTTAAVTAQLRTAADLADQARPLAPPPPVPAPPGKVTCVSPGYSVPTTGC